MGRALFSQKYISEPAVHEEQDPAAAPLDVPCERWSACNHFDPDSEEFFKDAQLEHFVDGPVAGPEWVIEGNNAEEAPQVVVLENVSDSSSSPSTISPTENDNGDSLSDSDDSPMAVGTDDPATLLAGAYTPVDWQRRFLEAGSDIRRQGRLTRSVHRNPRRLGSVRQYTNSGDVNHPLNPHRASPVSVFIPPAPYRTSSTAQAQEAPQQVAGSPRSPVTRRTVNITPINIPNEPSLPSPVSPSTPTTPGQNVIYPDTTNTLVTPSPAPNTTPRLYHWNHFPRAAASPTRDSPLTNPRARLSVSRIDTLSLAQRQYSTPVPVLDRRY
ncbi:hypothetical protein D9756_002398 [Leucocoprinus leucothites]|uniref:Uncharacterized protein n=1 Tax=Leucocoprinus leucothites TaxID=201217 RepID=A0A8H5GBD4_9AGAR|nr:hypothetical protein D9756_002398 [Leucoagaricus leucothites]